MGQWFLQKIYLGFFLNNIDGINASSNIYHILQENFNKESKTFSQLLDKENHKSVSNPSETII